MLPKTGSSHTAGATSHLSRILAMFSRGMTEPLDSPMLLFWLGCPKDSQKYQAKLLETFADANPR